MPNWSRIKVAILGWVHTSPWKPQASAPWARSSSSWPRCSKERRGAAPGAGRWRRPSSPPARARFSHWLTAPWVTPKASAMACCFQPFWWSSGAKPAALSPVSSLARCSLFHRAKSTTLSQTISHIYSGISRVSSITNPPNSCTLFLPRLLNWGLNRVYDGWSAFTGRRHRFVSVSDLV
jgi:hypothetical protein